MTGWPPARGASLLSLLLLLPTCIPWVPPPTIDPASGSIIIDSRSGFSNRVRVLAAYMHLAAPLNVTSIYMIWEVNKECTGHFLDVMEPIPNISFITSQQAQILEPKCRFRSPPSFSSFHFILKCHNATRGGETQLRKLFSDIIQKYFHPVPAVRTAASAFILSNNICSSMALHIRSTDFDKYLQINNLTLNQTCVTTTLKNVSSSSDHNRLFLMTDSHLIREQYIRIYGKDKIVVYGRFLASRGSDLLRETTLAHTVTEMLIAAHARSFCGNHLSTLTSLVNTYRRNLHHGDSICKVANSSMIMDH